MQHKIFEPARHNEESPAEGMASVNTFNPEETPLEEMEADQSETVRNKQEATGNRQSATGNEKTISNKQ